MNKKHIALITSIKWNIPTRCDKILAEELRKEGIQTDIVSWEKSCIWKSYDLIILRSCWDYHLYYKAFCHWLSELKATGIAVANGVSQIETNIDKEQQLRLLRNRNIPVIPSVVCTSIESARNFFEKEYLGCAVIKPSISASGYRTAVVRNEKELIRQARDILKDDKKIILQPFIDTVCNGEISMIFFHGVFSHAVRRYPGVTVVGRSPVPIDEPMTEWLEVASAVCREISAESMLYVRIDMIEYHSEIYVMEVELAEPDLYLNLEYGTESKPLKKFVEHIRREINL